jgi:Mg2+-importing ATPase
VVQEATDLAKSIADIILLKKDLGVIINGIALGRATFANSIKYVKITLAGNIGNVLTLSIVSFILPYLPLLPLQILLVNLLTDIPMIAIGTDAVDAHDLRRPCSYSSYDIIRTTIIFGLVGSLSDSLFFFVFHTLPAASVQTYWFIDNVVSDMLFTLSLRTKKIWFKRPHPSKILLILLIATGIIGIILPFTSIGQHFFSFVQPRIQDIIIMLTLSCIYFAGTETVKLLYVFLLNHGKILKRSFTIDR